LGRRRRREPAALGSRPAAPPEQLEARRPRRSEQRDAKALDLRMLGVREQEAVLRGVGRCLRVAQNSVRERIRARPMGVPERRGQLDVVRLQAHGAAC
jgi:hypothetical protein